jgi:probable F420-dependent oxidoreductase
MDRLLDVTQRTTIASAIINIWKHEPAEVGDWWRGESPARRERLLLGLGVSHPNLIADYQRPLAVMTDYIAALEAQGVPASHLCVAALRPKMLALSADRTAGSHPYLVTPEHTAAARAQLGPDTLIAPGQAVVLEADPVKARQIARGALAIYLPMPNYQASWRGQGFTQQDIETCSDRLCDALVAWGGADQIAARIRAHLDAGADHVCLKVVRGAPGGDATDLLDDWRALAAALL